MASLGSALGAQAFYIIIFCNNLGKHREQNNCLIPSAPQSQEQTDMILQGLLVQTDMILQGLTDLRDQYYQARPRTRLNTFGVSQTRQDRDS